VCDRPGTVGAEPCGPNAPLAGRDPDEDAGHTRSLGQRRAAAVSRSTRTRERIATLPGRRDARLRAANPACPALGCRKGPAESLLVDLREAAHRSEEGRAGGIEGYGGFAGWVLL